MTGVTSGTYSYDITGAHSCIEDTYTLDIIVAYESPTATWTSTSVPIDRLRVFEDDLNVSIVLPSVSVENFTVTYHKLCRIPKSNYDSSPCPGIESTV